MKLLRRSSICETIPPWFRFAYMDIFVDEMVIAPIGIHLLVRLYRRIWEWSYRYKPSKFESRYLLRLIQAKQDAYRQGYEHGKRDASLMGCEHRET